MATITKASGKKTTRKAGDTTAPEKPAANATQKPAAKPVGKPTGKIEPKVDAKTDKGLKDKTAKKRESVYNLAGFNKFFETNVASIGKGERGRIRKTRDKLIQAIIQNGGSNKKDELKAAIKEFKTFYTAVYAVTDFTSESLAANNADDDTKANVKLALEAIKRMG